MSYLSMPDPTYKRRKIINQMFVLTTLLPSEIAPNILLQLKQLLLSAFSPELFYHIATTQDTPILSQTAFTYDLSHIKKNALHNKFLAYSKQ